MKVEQVLSRFDRVHRSATGWLARCPAHADNNPSLSVRESNGRILLKCFAGCPIEAICEAAGIPIRELFACRQRPFNFRPKIVRSAEKQIPSLRTRLTPRDRERDVTVIYSAPANPQAAFARALALAVEGELVQVEFREVAK
jgi:hypothetical protein